MDYRTVVAAVVLGAIASPSGAAQDGSRQIWDSAFRQKRPAPAAPGSLAPGPAAPSPSRPVEPADPRPGAVGDAVDYRVDSDTQPLVTAASRVIGVTIWRLRAAESASTPGARLLVQERPGAAQEFVAHRVPSDEPLREGERIRIGLEIPSAGFLYVIDREKRADGSTGTPHLIFPARSLRGGDNRVEAGRLVEIPGQTDRVPALVVTPTSPDQVGEELLVLFTSTPLAELQPGERERPLAPELVHQLEERFAVEAQRLRQTGAPAERYWTTAERDASVSTRLLTQADPMPEVLYQANAKTVDGVMVRVPLPIASSR